MDFLRRLWSRSPAYSDELQRHEDNEKRRNKTVKFKHILIAAIVLIVPSTLFLAYTVLWTTHEPAPRARRFRLPTQITDIDERDASLPQHNLDLPFPEGRSGRFVRFASQHRAAADLGTLWDELTALATLSLQSRRAHVFRPLVLPDQSTLPLGLFLAGPSAGGNWGPGIDAPRAINNVFWELVCPDDRRRTLDIDDVEDQLGITSETDGKTLFDLWANYLGTLPDNCIEIDGSRGMFDLDFWKRGNSAMALWPTIASSPVLTRHTWSSLVTRAAWRNVPLLLTGTALNLNISSNANDTYFTRMLGNDDLLRPLLVLHLPSGESCGQLAGWAQLSSLPDAAQHQCTPSVAQIVTTAGLAREQYAAMLPAGEAPPSRVFIASSNATLVDALKTELLKNDGNSYASVTSSRDLDLRGLENATLQAVEVEISRRAALYVGNGFAPITSVVVALRLSQGSSPGAVRFW